MVTESFANDAHAATISYASDGSITSQSQSGSTLTFRFDARTNAYTVTVSGRTQTFLPGSLQPNGTYHVVSGSVVDDLGLSPTGTSAGNVYRYVGTGLWQRQIRRADGGVDGSLDAFVYGVPTASVPRTGRGYYTSQITGALSHQGNLYNLRGDGAMVGDFSRGVFDVSGKVLMTSAVSGIAFDSGVYVGQINLSATSNSLSSGFTVFGDSFGGYGGGFNGRFFGPSADEFGGSFSAQNSAGEVAVGTVMGRVDPAAAIVPFQSLTVMKPLDLYYFGQYYGKTLTYDPQARTYTFAAMSGSSLSGGGPSFRDSFGQITLGPDQKALVQQSTVFTEYNGSVDGRTVKAMFYNYGPANSEVQLSYASFVRLEVGPPAGSTAGPGVRYLLYGQPTPSIFIPTSGTATYSGLIFGSAEYVDGRQAAALGGQSTFAMDFGRGSITGQLLIDLNWLDGVPPTRITANFVNGTSFLGSGYVTSSYFGPNAEEFGVAFGGAYAFDRTPAPGQLESGVVSLTGVTIAKRQ